MVVVNLDVADILNDDVVKLEATRISGTGYIDIPQALESSTAELTEALIPADYDVKLVFKDPPFLEVNPEYQIFTVTNPLPDGVDDVLSLIGGVPPTEFYLEDVLYSTWDNALGVYPYDSSYDFRCPPWSRERADTTTTVSPSLGETLGIADPILFPTYDCIYDSCSDTVAASLGETSIAAPGTETTYEPIQFVQSPDAWDIYSVSVYPFVLTNFAFFSTGIGT